MAKRSATLDAEIRAALARIPRAPHLKTRPELDAEIDAILAAGSQADRYEIARALGFQYPKRAPSKQQKVTSTNLFALTELVIENGPRLPRRVAAVHAPHIKRCLAFGLIDPTTHELTRLGRGEVGRALIERIDSESRYQARENTFVTSPEKRAEILARDRAAHLAKLAKLESALASLG